MVIDPNMNFTIPVVGETLGPEWAIEINNALLIIGAHDHSTGKGVKVTPSGLNINTDLAFRSNNATQLRSTRYTSQTTSFSSSLDNNSISVLNGNLIFRDSAGNNIQITVDGGINIASVGTIGGDYGQPGVTAAASYSDTTKTFTWTQDSGIGAKMASADYALSAPEFGAQAITIKAPSGTTAYDFVLPSDPPDNNNSIQVFQTDGTSVFSTTLPANMLLTGNNVFTGTNEFQNTTLYTGNPLVTGSITRSGTSTGGTYDTVTIATPTITSGTITGSAVSGGTIAGAAISGGTLAGAAISNATFIGSNTGTGIVPVGAILPIAANISGSFSLPATGVVSQGWMLCDGAAIPGSNTLSGTTPTLNDERFLVGSSTAGTSGGANAITPAGTNGGSQSVAHSHTVNNHTHDFGHIHQFDYRGDNPEGASDYTYRNDPSGAFNANTFGAVGDPWLARTSRQAGTGSSFFFAYHNGTVNQPLYTANSLNSGAGSKRDTGGATPGTDSQLSTVNGSNFTFTGTSFNNRPLYLSTRYIIRVS